MFRRKPLLWILLSALLPTSFSAAQDGLFGEEILVPSGEVRMKLMLVRLPMGLASDLLLRDDRESDYWDIAVPALLADGRAEVVERAFLQGQPAAELKQDWTAKHQLTAYSSIALAAEKPDHAEDLLKKGSVEMGAGLRWKGLVTQTSAAAAATEWELEWVAPRIERRTLDTWPAAQGAKPELLMRRSVELALRSRVMPWSRATLLAAQMEPGMAGEIHRGQVVLVFGRIEKGAAIEGLAPSLRLDESAPVGSLWVLTLPSHEFRTWNLSRLSSLEDEHAFHGWLQRTGTDGIRLESVAAASGTCIIGGRREWACARRYRTSENPAFLLPLPSEGLAMEQMDHLLSMTDGSLRCEWPWKPETWARLPLTLSDKAADPALELPAVNRERLESWAHPLRDAPELIRAWTTQDGRVRACFARRNVPSAGAMKKREPRSIQNAWCIDTPLETWAATLEQLGTTAQSAIAEELLAAVRSGKVPLIDSMTCTVTRGHVNSDGHAGAASSALGDAIFLRLRPDGASFVPQNTPEDTAFMDWSTDWQADGSLINHEWRTELRPRTWQVRLPAAKDTAIRLLEAERSTLQASLDLRDGELCVLGAMRLPQTSAGRKTIRWWVGRQSPLDSTPSTPRSRRYLRAEVKDKLGTLLEQAVVALHDQVETVISRGTEWQFLEPRADESDSLRVTEAAHGQPFHPLWQIKEQVVGSILSIENAEWIFTRDMSVPRIVEDRFQHADAKGAAYEVAVQRPLFDIKAATGRLPQPGHPSTTTLGADAEVTVTLVP